MTIKKEDITCPTCNRKDTWKPDNTFRPFCSYRCKLIDLGDWAEEKHRISDESDTSEENIPPESNESEDTK